MTKQRNKNQAFTLVEILIGVAILAVTMTAMATLVIVSMRANTLNMNTLQAYYLSEQGLEAMKNVRDSNWMQNYGWDMGDDKWGADFDVCVNDGDTQYFTIDENMRATISFGSGDRAITLNNAPWDLVAISGPGFGDALYSEEETSGYVKFSHDSSGKETVFSRYIEVIHEDCGKELVKVNSVVSWGDGEVVLTTYLTDWQTL